MIPGDKSYYPGTDIPGDKSYYPGTDILVNKQDIRDATKARENEYRFAAIREVELGAKPIIGTFDYDHLKEIHRHVFQDVYAWAGQQRELDFAKRNPNTGMVNKYVPVFVMDIKAEDFNRFMQERNNLKDLSKPEFVKAITEVQVKLNELHPFREGNGRSTRVFLTQLAREAGYEIDISKVDKDRWNMASHRSLTQHDPKNEANKLTPNQSEMRQIFHEISKPTMAHAFKQESRAEALKLYPALEAAYSRLDAIAKYASNVPDTTAKRLLDAEKGRISEKLARGEQPTVNPYVLGRNREREAQMQLSNQTTNMRRNEQGHFVIIDKKLSPGGNRLNSNGDYLGHMSVNPNSRLTPSGNVKDSNGEYLGRGKNPATSTSSLSSVIPEKKTRGMRM